MGPMVGLIVCIPILLLIFMRFYLSGAVICKTQSTLEGKVVVVTGATSGIGRAVARACAKRGAKVILACRDKVKAEASVTSIRRKTANEDVHFLTLDLTSLQSVREFVTTFCRQFGRLDILVNNAAYLGPQAKTPDGFDRTFQVNYLGHFLLTVLLTGGLKRPDESGPMRVINMASDAYKKAELDFDDLMFEKRPYDMYAAYGASKLAMLLFTQELCYRYAGHGVMATSVHPGPVKTNLLRNWPGLQGNILRSFAKLFFRTPEGGAQSVVHCATADDTDDMVGKLIYDCSPLAVESEAKNYRSAERLWQISMDLCGVENANTKA